MTTSNHPFAHGRLAYVQIPALDVRVSAAFYKEMFGWAIRSGSDAHVSFTDATGDVIGAFITGRSIAGDSGVIFYIYVHGLDVVLAKLTAAGTAIVKPPYPEGDLWVATFRDPAGNVIGIWQQGPR